MAQNDYSKQGFDDGGLSPIKRFATTRFVRREVVLKQEIEAYYVSDVDNSAFLRMGNARGRALASPSIYRIACVRA